ncbi:MAG: hypothetical protein COA86_12845 [Kangiella sp.]|nr:MAG: hypothetical protein COA86_12845 [Kangiella sp.]
MKTKVAAIFLLIIVVFIVNALNDAGAFKNIEPHSDIKDIKIYTNVAGTEDLDMDRKKGLLFISSTNRWHIDHSDTSKDGIYLLDLNAQKMSEPVLLETTYKGEFHPHGISFLSKNDQDYLFVINHNLKGNFIEVFQFEDNLLTHIKTYEHEQMCCPNDLVAVDIDKFYVSNDHGAAKGFARTLEEYLKLANSYLLYFNGKTYSKALEGLSYANGVNVSHDGKTLYVTEVSGGKIFVMNRDVKTGKLTLRFAKDLNTGLDNVDIDEDGNIWIGAHPQLLAFVGHAQNPSEISPSQVLMLTHKGEDDFKVSEVYLNKGEEISASSVALRYKDQIFVGVVFENKLLRGTFKVE